MKDEEVIKKALEDEEIIVVDSTDPDIVDEKTLKDKRRFINHLRQCDVSVLDISPEEGKSFVDLDSQTIKNALARVRTNKAEKEEVKGDVPDYKPSMSDWGKDKDGLPILQLLRDMKDSLNNCAHGPRNVDVPQPVLLPVNYPTIAEQSVHL